MTGGGDIHLIHLSLSRPKFHLMSKLTIPSHAGVQSLSVHCSLRSSVRKHVSRVHPTQRHRHMRVQQFTDVLDMV